MAKQRPNKYGVYADYEKVEIPIPKNVRAQVVLCVCECQDGFWRSSVHVTYRLGGYGSAPGINDIGYKTRLDAIAAAFEEALEGTLRRMEEKGKKTFTKAMRAFYDENGLGSADPEPAAIVFSPQGDLAFCEGLEMLCVPRVKKKAARPALPPIVQLSLFPDPDPAPEDPVDALIGKGFSRDEAKILLVGFDLLRYDRPSKTVWIAESQITWDSNANAWAVDPEKDAPRWYKTGKSPYKNFAEAERAVKAILGDGATIEVTDNGHVSDGAGRKLLAESEGFEFYRSEGIIPGHGTPRIKSMSTNWGNWNKFETGKECKDAWDELMLTPKALEG